MRFFSKASICAAVLFLFFPPAVIQPVPHAHAASGVRDLTVGVAVTPDFMTIPQWKDEFKQRLRYASGIFEREFRIRLKEAVFWTWEPSNPRADLGELLDELMAAFPLSASRVDIIIGLTRLGDLSQAMDVRDLHALGRARPFSGYMVLRYPHHSLFRIQEETILVHELGHLFGAVHTDKAETVMAPVADRQIPTSFDEANRRIISMTRAMNFQKGAEALDPSVIQFLVNAYRQMTDTDQSSEFHYALARFYLKLGESENALRTLEQMARMEPDNGIVRHDLGVLYFRTGQYENARRELQAALNRFDRTGESKNRASAYSVLGSIYFREQNTSGAHHAWSSALALDPDNQDVRINLAVVNLERGQVAAARNELEKLLLQNPGHIRILTHLGAASFRQKNYREAVDYYQKASRALQAEQAQRDIRPEDASQLADIYTGLGSAYWQMNDRKQAAQFFDLACRADPSTECHEKMGRIHYELGHWDLAISELVLAIKERKDNPDLYGLLGIALTKKGQTEQAIAVFQEGLRYVRDSVQAARLHANNGHLYLQIQRPDRAVTEFLSAISRDWNSRDAHFGLGLAYLMKSSPHEAKSAFQNVLKIDPGHEDAKKYLAVSDRMIRDKQEMQASQFTFTFQPKSES